MGHRFFAIIDDKIPGPYTNTCYHHLPCQNIESVERTPHSRTQTAAVLPPRLVQGNCDPNQLKHQQTAAVPTQLRTEIKQKDTEFQLLTPGISNHSVSCLLLQFMSPKTEKENS